MHRESCKLTSRKDVRFGLSLCLFLLLAAASVADARTIYVKPGGSDGNPGSDWSQAKATVTAALAAAVSGDEIWVAAGTYAERITMKNGVALYGGFAGTETTRDQRNWRTNVTTLNGTSGGTVVPVAGGADDTGSLSSAELYNPTMKTFSATGSMMTARYGHSATLLADGKVLMAGGMNSTGILNSAEMYDPLTGLFSPVGSMDAPRESHSATQLPDGSVLIAGGYNYGSGSLATAESYDLMTGTFSARGRMNAARSAHPAVLLDNGLVLVAGGFTGPEGSLDSSELYNPTGVVAVPDLVILGIYADAGTVVPEQQITITVTVKNQGDASAGSFRLDVYKSLPSRPSEGQGRDQSCTISDLTAGASSGCTFVVSYPTVGTHSLWAQVDTTDTVAESEESNNTLRAPEYYC